MQSNRNRHILIWSLLASFFIMGIAMAGGAAQHATVTHHDHNMHSQTWCGWMCAAGQALQGPATAPEETWQPIAQIDLAIPQPALILLVFSPGSRGPPSTS
ncbi:MAG: hypothetical protein GKS05_11195 [Nitrospirales bacterium]|nr:hypothetical protein [Nitrospirales bacterium]